MPVTAKNRLRMRRYAGRLKHAFGTSGLQTPLVFMHMPKCGGTSLSEALYATVPIQHRIGVIDAVSTRRAAALLEFGQNCPWLCHDDTEYGHFSFSLRHSLMLQHMCWDTRLIHGHLLFSELAITNFGTPYKFITVLRDPAKRMISNYRMAYRAGLTQDDFTTYLGSPLAKSHARIYLRYLSGQNHPATTDLDGLTELAISRLQNFCLIGFLEHLDLFQKQFRTLFGPRLHIRQYNTGQDKHPDINNTDHVRMTRLLRHDQKIYDHAWQWCQQ